MRAGAQYGYMMHLSELTCTAGVATTTHWHWARMNLKILSRDAQALSETTLQCERSAKNTAPRRSASAAI
jgi:hypothetical protein